MVDLRPESEAIAAKQGSDTSADQPHYSYTATLPAHDSKHAKAARHGSLK